MSPAGSLQDRGGHCAVVDFPLEPVTPMIAAGQFSISSPVVQTAPRLTSKAKPGSWPNRRIDHNQIGVLKSSSVAA